MADVLGVINDGLNKVFDDARKEFLNRVGLASIPPVEAEKRAKKEKLRRRAQSLSFRPRCSCGFKIRGKNHSEGAHHNGTVR